MKAMNTAPKNGSEIEVMAHGKWWEVTYHDCKWMRDDPDPGIDPMPDAWMVIDGSGPGHIELDEAVTWRDVKTLMESLE